MITYTSRTDQPWWSDPEYSVTGIRLVHPYPADYEPDDWEPDHDICPGCGDSVDHPLYYGRYADNVRLIGQPMTGWHNECAETIEAERDAVMAASPLTGGCRE